MSESNFAQKYDALSFIQELCGIARPFPKEFRTVFYRSLILIRSMGTHGIYSLFQTTLSDPEPKIRLVSMSILTHVLEHNPEPVRSFCLAQAKNQKKPLIDTLIDRVLEERNAGLQLQLVDNIRILLDTSSIGSTDVILAK